MIDVPIDGRPRRSLATIVVAVGVVGLILRLWLVGTMLHQGARYDRVAGDDKQYLDLARNLVELGRFADDAPSGRNFGTTYYSLLRPPGYPMFCALFERFDHRAGIVWTQAVLGAAVPMLVAWLAGTMLASRVAAAVAGAVAAISPTGVGLSGLILADLPFALVFLAGFALLWQAARGERRATWYVAGATFGVACLIKPIGLYWTLATPIVAWFLARAVARRVKWRHLAGGLAIGVAMMLAWAGRNYAHARVFTISTVDAQNLRYYLAPAVEEWVRSNGDPDRRKSRALRGLAMRRDERDVLTMPPREIYLRQWRESLDVLRPNPGSTIAAMWDHIENHFRSGFSHFDDQLPKGGALRRSLAAIEAAWLWDGTDDVVIVLLIVSVALPPIVPTAGRDPSCWMRWHASVALAFTFVYLVFFTGTTTSTGARIVYPAQFAEVLLVVAGAVSIARDVPAIARRHAIVAS